MKVVKKQQVKDVYWVGLTEEDRLGLIKELYKKTLPYGSYLQVLKEQLREAGHE